MCGNGLCIPPSKVCDGIVHCDNDEDSCCEFGKYSSPSLFHLLTSVMNLLQRPHQLHSHTRNPTHRIEWRDHQPHLPLALPLVRIFIAYPSVYLSTCLPGYLSTWLPVYLSTRTLPIEQRVTLTKVPIFDCDFCPIQSQSVTCAPTPTCTRLTAMETVCSGRLLW